MDNVLSFMDKFGNTAMESYFFYQNSVEIRFDPVEHIYYLVEDLGNLTPLLNVSTVSHIVDRSAALIPWAAKMTVEKLLRTIPTYTSPLGTFVPEMPLEVFTMIALEAKSAHKDKLESAGEIGKDAHYFLEEWIKTGISGKLEEQNNMLRKIGVEWQEL